jgi:hypothetical protein
LTAVEIEQEQPMIPQGNSSPDDRVARLERQVRQLKNAMVVVLLAAGAVVLGVVFAPSLATGQRNRTLVGNRIELRDTTGRVRISLDAAATPGLVLHGADGTALAGLSVGKGTALLYLNDTDGRQRAVLSVLPGGFGLGLNDERGRALAALKVTDAGPVLVMRDKYGKVRTSIAVRDKGPAMMLHDGRGRLRAGLGVSKAGPMLDLRDAKGTARAGLRVDERKGSQFALKDATGRTFYHKP